MSGSLCSGVYGARGSTGFVSICGEQGETGVQGFMPTGEQGSEGIPGTIGVGSSSAQKGKLIYQKGNFIYDGPFDVHKHKSTDWLTTPCKSEPIDDSNKVTFLCANEETLDYDLTLLNHLNICSLLWRLKEKQVCINMWQNLKKNQLEIFLRIVAEIKMMRFGQDDCDRLVIECDSEKVEEFAKLHSLRNYFKTTQKAFAFVEFWDSIAQPPSMTLLAAFSAKMLWQILFNANCIYYERNDSILLTARMVAIKSQMEAKKLKPVGHVSSWCIFEDDVESNE